MIKCCLCSYCVISVMVFVKEEGLEGQPVNCKLVSGPDICSGFIFHSGSRMKHSFLPSRVVH